MIFGIKHFNGILTFIHITALYIAVNNEDINIIKLLLINDKLDINKVYVKILNLLIKFEINKFNSILIYQFL